MSETDALAADLAAKRNLATALVTALADLTVIATGRTVSAGAYSYDYADLGDIVKLTRPVLAQHGIVALTPIHDHGTGLACTVTLLHTSGERLDLGPFPFPHGRDAQATGSMVTYHRRYALVAALGMAAGDDDDGAAAVPRQHTEPVPGGWGSLAEQKAKWDELRSATTDDDLKVWVKAQGITLGSFTRAQAEEWEAHLPAEPVASDRGE